MIYNLKLKKIILTLIPLSCILFICNCRLEADIDKNINQKEAQNLTKEYTNQYEPEYKFTDSEIDKAMNIAKDYYKDLGISNQIKSIDYDLTDKVYGGAFGTLDEYKNSNSIIFLVTTTDENIPRIIILTRNDKDSEWGVVDEGY